MADYSWPTPGSQQTLGRRLSRLDGPVKATGAAKYSYDKSLPGMLYGKMLTCPHAHARIKLLDVNVARGMDGVRAVRVIQDVGAEVQWAHDEIVAVAAISEDIARDALRAVRIEYEVLPHYVIEEDPSGTFERKEPQEQTEGDPDAAFEASAVIVEHELAIPQIAHMCLEAHGQVAEWEGDDVTVWASTQGVSTLPQQFVDGGLDTKAANVRIRCDYMGGGFGSKFSPDRWGVVGAQLARDAGAPVKMFLDRDQEVAVAGSRPSTFAKIRAGVSAEGKLLAWESETWGSGGRPGTGSVPVPYVFAVPNQRKRHTSVPTHLQSSRAWRAPNHPQACFLTMATLDDLAAKLEMDPLDFVLANLELTGRFEATYREQLQIAAERSDWRRRWRPRTERDDGPLQRGLGLSLHTWGGRGHQSRCDVAVNPDGSVEARIGTQDLGTGTRTVIAMVLAETFGLDVDQVTVRMGDSRFPQSGPSGGSSTVGGVTGSTRRAAQDALRGVFTRIAPSLDAQPEQLVARAGKVEVTDDPSRSMPWSEAASLIGAVAVTVGGRNPGRGQLNDSGVGGVQIADVTVDIETGVVDVNKLLAVQDCGLVVNEKLAESQIYSGLIMGVGYALFEELIPDPHSGRLLNADMEFYRLAGLGDVGTLEAVLMQGPAHQQRGVIGLGEPPVISPGAALSNAVANAIGHRVPRLPMTPERVLETLMAAELAEESA